MYNFLFMSLLFQISRDCQELEPSVGEQLASLLYLEPDSELMVCQQFGFCLTWHELVHYSHSKHST